MSRPGYLLLSSLLLATSAPGAGGPGWQPWMLAAEPVDAGASFALLRDKLAAAQFVVLEDTESDAQRLLVTSPDLQTLALVQAQRPWLAVLPLQLQSHTEGAKLWHPHLPYFARALGHEHGWQALQNRLAQALGAVSLHGPAQDEARLPMLRYARGFEGVADHYRLGKHGSQIAAVALVNERLRARWRGLRSAYSLTLPNGAALIGLDLHQADQPELRLEEWPEQYGLRMLLPYPLLIHEGRAQAPHLRYWLALFAPDLPLATMLKLGSRADSLEQLLQDLVGGQQEEFRF